MTSPRVIELDIAEVVLHGVSGFDGADRHRLRRALAEALEARLAGALEAPAGDLTHVAITGPTVTLPATATPRAVAALGDELASAILEAINAQEDAG